jgi:hypothetical protein
MARWRVDYRGKRGFFRTFGTVEAPDEKSALEQAAKQFNITPARHNKIVVTRIAQAEQASVPPPWGADAESAR